MPGPDLAVIRFYRVVTFTFPCRIDIHLSMTSIPPGFEPQISNPEFSQRTRTQEPALQSQSKADERTQRRERSVHVQHFQSSILRSSGQTIISQVRRIEHPSDCRCGEFALYIDIY